MYLTLDEFTDMGFSVDLDEAVYARLEAKARSYIDRLTFGRLKNENPLRESAKHCMYELISALYADESYGGIALGREIASMSNDGMSVSFASSASAGSARSLSARYTGIVRTWLASECDSTGTSLMFPGVCVV